MALKTPATPLVITLLQGSADAFVQGSVLTGLAGRQAYNLVGVAWQMTTSPSQIDGAEYSVAITRRSKTAIPLLSDNDVIITFGWMARFTTSGSKDRDRSGYWKPELEIPLVEDTIYAQLDSTSSTVANNFILRLDVELDTISDIDRLNLIARSLA